MTRLHLLHLLVVLGGVRAAPPIIVAHRGASGYSPEHTLPAKALACGMFTDFPDRARAFVSTLP
jgi:glycerophosphoryl diester phosphodiesterase